MNALWATLLSFDQRLLLAVRRLESRLMTRLMRAFTRLGDPESWTLLGLALGFSGGDGPRHCALLGLGAGFAVATSQIVKRVCCRKRPSCGIGGFAALAENPDAFSFPSGHTSVAFAVAAAFAGEGSGLGAFALALAFGIALSRIYLGAHYPLDVAAGVLVGAGAGVLARLVVGGYPTLALLGHATLTPGL